MKTIEVPVFIAVMKGTEVYDQPIVQVTKEPFGADSFRDYHWFRAMAKLSIEDQITDAELSPVTPVLDSHKVKE